MIVIFDTNIWKSNLDLRSPASAAVRAYLKLHDATVCMPEMVELEIKHHLSSDLRRFRNRAKDGHDRLLAFFGKLSELKLP